MEDFRSKSCKMGSFYGGKTAPTSMQGLRCYSANCAAYPPAQPNQLGNKEIKIKKSKNSLGSSKSWSFNDPELRRKKRVATYKVYAVEGKMKGSLRKSLKWIKNTYSKVVYGWQ